MTRVTLTVRRTDWKHSDQKPETCKQETAVAPRGGSSTNQKEETDSRKLTQEDLTAPVPEQRWRGRDPRGDLRWEGWWCQVTRMEKMRGPRQQRCGM